MIKYILVDKNEKNMREIDKKQMKPIKTFHLWKEKNKRDLQTLLPSNESNIIIISHSPQWWKNGNNGWGCPVLMECQPTEVEGFYSRTFVLKVALHTLQPYSWYHYMTMKINFS